MSRIVIVVDTQADFMKPDGALAVAGAHALIRPMGEWLRALDTADTAAVLFTFDTHFADTYPGSAEALQFPIHCVRGEPGWANVLSPDLVDPAIPTFRMEKGVFAMWEEDGLTVEPIHAPGREAVDRERFFAALHAAGVHQAVVIGVAADFCVRWAIEGLLARGFSVRVPAALTRGIGRDMSSVAAEEFARQPLKLV
jgi:nicotinamidase/pyrazinamidase